MQYPLYVSSVDCSDHLLLVITGYNMVPNSQAGQMMSGQQPDMYNMSVNGEGYSSGAAVGANVQSQVRLNMFCIQFVSNIPDKNSHDRGGSNITSA